VPIEIITLVLSRFRSPYSAQRVVLTVPLALRQNLPLQRESIQKTDLEYKSYATSVSNGLYFQETDYIAIKSIDIHPMSISAMTLRLKPARAPLIFTFGCGDQNILDQSGLDNNINSIPSSPKNTHVVSRQRLYATLLSSCLLDEHQLFALHFSAKHRLCTVIDAPPAASLRYAYVFVSSNHLAASRLGNNKQSSKF